MTEDHLLKERKKYWKNENIAKERKGWTKKKKENKNDKRR